MDLCGEACVSVASMTVMFLNVIFFSKGVNFQAAMITRLRSWSEAWAMCNMTTSEILIDYEYRLMRESLYLGGLEGPYVVFLFNPLQDRSI